MDEADELDLAPLEDAVASRPVGLRVAGAALEGVAAAGVDGLTRSQAAGPPAALRAAVEGHAEGGRGRGEPDEVELAELREMLADVLFDDDYGEAVIEPRQHGAPLGGAVAPGDALPLRLGEGRPSPSAPTQGQHKGNETAKPASLDD